MRFHCFYCHKPVTNELPEESGIRAIAVCPECIKSGKDVEEYVKWLNEQITTAETDIRRWKLNEDLSHTSSTMFSKQDCKEMQNSFRLKKEAFELVRAHILENGV
jgi:hypothetical protein